MDVRFLARERAVDIPDIRACVERAIDESGPDAIDSLSTRLRTAGADWANRLTAIAGPKVYSNISRRFFESVLRYIKVPQSSDRSSDDAVMNPRDVARAARGAIQIARERLSMGEALLIFAEGSRSRSGRMQQFLAGTARYLDVPGTWVLPMEPRSSFQ